MTERALATDALSQQDPAHESATLENTTFATDGTTLDVTTREDAPLGSRPSNAVTTSSDQDISESQDHTAAQPTAVIASSEPVKYRSAAMQTLPPNDAKEFYKIYGRQPTNQELVTKTGSAAIGRYGLGPSANPYDVILGTSFPTPVIPARRANYTDSSFQTNDAAQCKKALLRAKVKASLLASRQRTAAQSAGYRVWSETRDEYIVHSGNLHVSVHFDEQGNAINANVDGLSLSNIYGEEIDPHVDTIKFMRLLYHELPYAKAEMGKKADQHNYSATSAFTPPLTPPSTLLHDPVDSVTTPQRIRTVEPHVPSENSDPASIEFYGYVQLVPREATEKDGNRNKGKDKEQQKTLNLEVSGQAAMRGQKERSKEMVRKGETVLVIGGERFADKYIVYDATASNLTNPTTQSDTHPTTTRKRKSGDKWEPEEATISPKRSKTSLTHTNSKEVGTSIQKGNFVQHQDDYAEIDGAENTGIDFMQPRKDPKLAESQQDRTSTSQAANESENETKDGRYPHRLQTYWDSRRRSRSPLDRCSRNRYRSRTNIRRQSENPYQKEGQRHEIAHEADEELQSPSNIMNVYNDKHNHFTEDGKSDGRDHSNLPHNNKESQSYQARSSSRSAKPSAAERIDTQQLSRRQEVVDEMVLARKVEDDRRLEQVQQVEEAKLAKRRQQEEAEIQRARDAKNQRKLEIGEKKQVQEADHQRRQKERDRNSRRRRDDSQDRSKRGRRKVVKETAEPHEQVDEYATAREAEAQRRERVFAARSTGEAEGRGRERSPARNESFSRLRVEQPKLEQEVKDRRVTKSRASRTARGELERYDPRKKFGGGS